MEEDKIVFDKPLDIQREIVRKYENYILYQVYGLRNDKKYPLYKTCENTR